MSNEKFEVTSEILEFFEKDTQSKPCVDDKNVVSKFKFSFPGGKTPENRGQKDEDGDYVLVRKGEREGNELTIYLEHSVSTELNLVGLQIWRAALLIADFIIHNENIFKNQIILELGSGVGLTSIVAAIFAKKVIITDVDVGDVLKLIQSNVDRNKVIIKSEISVCGLDFFNRNWNEQLMKEIQQSTIVIAADVIYDNDVTSAFVETILKILSTQPPKILYLALEKRYVFTISDLDSVAPCYEHLVSCLSKPPCSTLKITEVSLDFPQYFNYERVRQLIMYKIST